MAPVDFNPSSRSIDLQNKQLNKKGNGNDINDSLSTQKSTASSPIEGPDTFVKSELLQKMQSTSKSTAGSLRLQELKTQIENRTHPILADSAAERLDSARKVADKISIFEKQMASLEK